MTQSRRAGSAHLRRRVLRVGPTLALVGALSLPGLAACSYTNPTLVETYAASDGVNTEVTDSATGVDLKFRNLLLVASEEGSPGSLLGGVANDGPEAIPVQLVVLGPDGSQLGGGIVEAAPGELTTLGEEGKGVAIPEVPVVPGSVITLKVVTPVGGSEVNLPVMAAEGYYAEYARTPEPTPSESPSESASPSAEASPS